MSYYIDIQHACNEPIPLSDQKLTDWAEFPLIKLKSAELTLRLVDAKEMTQLNIRLPQQNKPTNVLAFPTVLPANIELEFPLLGDVIICPAVLLRKALSLENH